MSVRSHILPFAALCAAAILALSACSAGSSPTGAESTTSAAPVPAGLEQYYEQDVDWTQCGSVIECATINVPLDYDQPKGDSIELSLNRRAAKGATRNLLVNPGGPGGSGVDMVTQSVPVMFSNDLQRNFNIIGFDPRGVGDSTPVTCQTDAEIEEGRQENLQAWDPEDRQQIIDETEEYVDDCAENTGELLGHVDTKSAAKDMDIIRAVLGDAQLDYLGYSYGTYLGATYADLFPQNVGRFVLDGAMDPTVSSEELTLAQAKGFEGEIDAWLADCLNTEQCPFTGTPAEAKTQLQQFFAQVEEEPMESSDGRAVPIIDMVNGFILPLYDNMNWPYLTQAMAAAINENDVDQMLYFADLSAERTQDGKYPSNSTDAFTAVNCLDHPMDDSDAAMKADAQALQEASPTLGKYLAYGQITCGAWDFPATGSPQPLDAAGSAPILVVGTTNDPATPYEWSQALAKQLQNSSLLTYQGHGHTAYGRSNECITQAVDGFLINGKLPEDGTTC